MNSIIVAILAALGPILAALAAWAGLRNGQKLKTSNGKTIGEYSEGNAFGLIYLHELLLEHTKQDQARFDEITKLLGERTKEA